MHLQLRQDQLIVCVKYESEPVTVWKLKGQPPPATAMSSTASSSSSAPSVVLVAEISCGPSALVKAVDIHGKMAAVATKTRNELAPATYQIVLFDTEQKVVTRVIPLDQTFTSMSWLGREDIVVGQRQNGNLVLKVEVRIHPQNRSRLHAPTDMPASTPKRRSVHTFTRYDAHVP